MADLCYDKWELLESCVHLETNGFTIFCYDFIFVLKILKGLLIIMEILSRLYLYQRLTELNWFNTQQQNALKLNIDVLSNIEPLFLSQDEAPEEKEIKDPLIFSFFTDNIRFVEERWGNGGPEVKKLLKAFRKLADEYGSKQETINQNSRNLFNKIINILGEFNSHFFNDEIIPGDFSNREAEYIRGGRPQVFLSHAYDDKLYAAALFRYFYEHDVFLYVDWMHHGPQTDGRVLKAYLNKELNNSDQLLFLRTLNSELNIQGKQMLRSWCAWELGNFYRREDGHQKYLLNLYSVEKYENSLNLQIHGLKLFTGIDHGRLTGIAIIPQIS